MKLNGYYQDGTVIASGAFGVVYIVPFENGVAAVADVATIPGSRKFLARERLVKLIDVDKTLTYSKDFNPLDVDALYSESQLNSVYSTQGGWNLNTSAADGTYTTYIPAFTGNYIQTPEMVSLQTSQALMTGAVLAVVKMKLEQQRKVGVFEQLTGWRF